MLDDINADQAVAGNETSKPTLPPQTAQVTEVQNDTDEMPPWRQRNVAAPTPSATATVPVPEAHSEDETPPWRQRQPQTFSEQQSTPMHAAAPPLFSKENALRAGEFAAKTFPNPV